MDLLDRLVMRLPIVQAPMAGVSPPALAAAVSEAGGLGSLGLGAGDAAAARAAVLALRQQTGRAFNVNLFAHAEAAPDPARDRAWLAALTPAFRALGAEPPAALRPLYRSIASDRDMLTALIDLAPPVVSFHFGLPPADALGALRERGVVLMATATSPAEARAIEAAGLDAIVAQGIEAGGHRGMFDPEAPDAGLGTLALTRLLVRQSRLPVIAAGGIMDGAGIAAVLRLGAVAAQMGTAFVACPESAASETYRAALTGPGAQATVLTDAISGRPARCLGNRFTALAGELKDRKVAAYPYAYDAGKALAAAARARGEAGFDAQWAGQGAPLARTMPAAALMAELARELAES